jgi:hypothetical protein
MNPDKLFDYLDGNLSPGDRDRLEEQLLIDPQLQRQLAVAREIHRGGRSSREVIMPLEEFDQQRAGRIGRGVATAFAGLVLLNVLIGIAFIVGKNRAPKPASSQVRQQVTDSLNRAAAAGLPAPTLAQEVRLTAATPEARDKLADNVLVIAREAGGEATKAPPDDGGVTVLATIPSKRVPEFRRGVAPLAGVDFSSPAPAEDRSGVFGEKTTVYVRITEPGPSPIP